MISLLKGKVRKKNPELTVIETSGVGYGVIVSARTLSELPDEGGEAELIVHTHLSVNSREGALELFGFSSSFEEDIFRKLLGISGIGPRAALKILASITAEELTEAVIKGDLDKRKIPGLGAKRAATIMNELKGKVSAVSARPPRAKREVENIVSALKNYGFKNTEIEKVANEIEEIAQSSESIEVAVKNVLSIMRR